MAPIFCTARSNSVPPTDVTDLAWSPEDRYLASVGLDSQVLIWSGYTLGGLFSIIDPSPFHHDMAVLPSKNEYAESISTMVSSRVFAGTQLGSFWQRSPTIAVSKSGVQWIGNSRLRFENLSKILLEAPFSDDSGETGHFRLFGGFIHLSSSWSPDGAHITASNATNNKGFVFIAAVIARNSWTSEISLVGHENTVEVAVSPR